MRISDWSSDVCSSDLPCHRAPDRAEADETDGHAVDLAVDAACRLLVPLAGAGLAVEQRQAPAGRAPQQQRVLCDGNGLSPLQAGHPDAPPPADIHLHRVTPRAALREETTPPPRPPPHG